MDVSRRSMLRLGAAAPVLFLAACTSPPDAPDETVPPLPPSTVQNTARPASSPSFGPNGTHYPSELPWLGDTAPNDLEVDCSWIAISRAINSLTAEQAAAGTVIRVRPGVLVGGGAGSRRTPVLSGLGDPSWERSVVICPRDGYGTVSVREEGFRVDDCHRLAIFGLRGADVEFYATNCTAFTVGWSEWSAISFTQSGADLDLYEVVLGFRRSTNDTFAVRPTDSNEMLRLRRYGCVFGPSVKPAGDKSHLDTIQLERTGSGAFGPFESVDCVDFGSTNAAILVHDSVSTAEFRHCLVLGERLPWEVFPLAPGDEDGTPNAFAGGGPDVRLTDSVVCGPIGRVGFTHVVNTRISYEPVQSQMPSVEGAWTVDPSIADWSADDLREVAGTDFSRESLAAHWAW